MLYRRVWWVDLDTRCPPKLLYRSLLSIGQGRESITKDAWVEITTGRDQSAITITCKTDSPWGKLM